MKHLSGATLSLLAVFFCVVSSTSHAVTDSYLNTRSEQQGASAASLPKPSSATSSSKKPSKKSLPGIQTSQRQLRVEGKTLRFEIRRYVNTQGEPQLSVELQDPMPFLSRIVLYARDLDQDKKYDIWFVPTQPGSLDAYDRVAQEADGWDVAQDLLLNTVHIENNSAWPVFFDRLSRLSMASEFAYQYFDQLVQRQMTLYSAEILGERLLKDPLQKDRGQMLRLYATAGWEQLGSELGNVKIHGVEIPVQQKALEHMSHAVAEGLVWVFGGRLVMSVGGKIAAAGQSAMKASGEAFSKALPPELKAQTAKLAGEMIQGITQKTQQALQRLSQHGSAATGGALQVARVTTKNIFTETALLVRGLSRKIAFEKNIRQRMLPFLKERAVEMKTALKENQAYVKTVIGTNIATEAVMRRNDFIGSDPYIVSTRMKSARDMFQNVLFNADETILQTAVGESVKGPLSKRLGICGLVSVADSTLIGTSLKGESDPYRITFDTAWQASVGNLQTWADIKMLRVLEAHAVQNPRLKLVGWAVVLVDQAIGSTVYYWLTTNVFNKKEARKSGHGMSAPAAPTPPAEPEIRLIPIFENDTAV